MTTELMAKALAFAKADAAADKELFRDFARGVDDAITGLASVIIAAGGVAYETRAELYADLVPGDGATGLVYLDPDENYNGIYKKSGVTTSGNWIPTNILITSSFRDTINGIQADTDRVLDYVDQSQQALIDIFIDPYMGIDTNDGATVFTPKKTFAGAASLHFDGAVVGLVCGGEWRERFTPGYNNMKLVSYGFGAKPITRGDDVLSAGGWTKTGGRTYIYNRTLTVEADANAVEVPRIYENDSCLTYVASLALCDSTPGSYYHADPTGLTSVTIYVHPKDDTDPRSDGKVYEAPVRKSGVWGYDVTGFEVRGIRGKREYCSYGSITLGRSSRAYNIQCDDGSYHNFFMRANSAANNVLCTDGYAGWIGGSNIPFVAYESSAPASATIAFTNCKVVLSAYNATTVGVLCHTAGGGATNWTQMTLLNFQTKNCGYGIEGENLDTLIISGGKIDNYVVGVKPGATLTSISGALQLVNPKSGAVPIIFGQAGITVNITGVDWDFGGTSGTIQMTLGTGTLNLTNSKLANANIFLTASGTSPTITVNNVEFVPKVGSYYIYNITGSGYSLTSDYNKFNTAISANNFQIGATLYASATAYIAGTGKDSHSTV